MKDENQRLVPSSDSPATQGGPAVRSKRRTLSRRDFLKIAGATAALAAAGAGGITAVRTLTQDQLEALKGALARILARQYGAATGQMLDQKIQQELEKTLAELPFIGTSQENKWADNMPSAAFALAAYRVLVPEYATLEDAGHILYETLQLDMGGFTSLVMQATYNETAIIEKLRLLAIRSQKRQYPEDWVMTFVEGTGQDFTYGVDVTECAIRKYLAAQGAPELTPYLCLTDYISSEAMGRGLVRYKTLAEGCALCDFRYKKGRSSYLYPLRNGWPPKFADSC
ncbi:MAG TPA: L-2-amino-thiazoline-4-carboxylic acid hydrolase [Anaerolineales bacterium]|nr:L-2-amino-thiazoline-4-carboxylic acid hydrolase [Anaerolineales bacterium]